MLRWPLMVLVFALIGLAPAPRAWADETDNFTCRMRPLRDGLTALDALMNERIRAAIDRANQKVRGSCDEQCRDALVRDELRNAIGGSVRQLPMFVPHSRFAKSAGN